MNREWNILILSAGRRVELVNCFKAARDRLKIEGKVLAADLSDSAPALYFADEHFRLPRIGTDGYLETLIGIARENRVSLIVPTIDTELEFLAKKREKIEEESGAKVLISDLESVEICCDKIRTAKFFRDHGFALPKVITAEMIEAEDYTFPLFIKPFDGSSSVNAFKVRNKRELAFFLSYIDHPILQEFVKGTEYTVDCFADFAGNIITVVPRIRLQTRSGEILKGRIDKNASIIADVKRLVKELGLIGHVTVQGFWGEDGIFRYIEINPRFGGGAPMSIMAGADSCENLYRLLRGETLTYHENYEDGATFSRFDSSIRIDTL